jgi:hypothetical protein
MSITILRHLRVPSFEFNKRSYESSDQFNAVLLIPTGIDAEIGAILGTAAQ